jgi:outer membrane protein assembly factor BamE (lipoprotein component of BamABCDE complex)
LLKKRRFINLCHLFVGVSVLALSLSACESRKGTRGNLLDPERVVEIRPGEQSRAEVAKILGSPSSVTPFTSDTWYYISQRVETFAFFAPEVMERQIVVVSFDKKGKVSKIDNLGLENGQAINPVARTTPTHGNKMTVLEQLVGNLGRFKKTNRQRAEEGN